jgi:hypothetical protein
MVMIVWDLWEQGVMTGRGMDGNLSGLFGELKGFCMVMIVWDLWEQGVMTGRGIDGNLSGLFGELTVSGGFRVEKGVGSSSRSSRCPSTLMLGVGDRRKVPASLCRDC